MSLKKYLLFIHKYYFDDESLTKMAVIFNIRLELYILMQF